MPRSIEALVTPALLIWARESVAMSLADAAQRLTMSEDRLRSWEDGNTRPTVNQLRRIASLYKQPFAAFFLSEAPPVFRPPLKEYRRLPDLGEFPPPTGLFLDVRMALERRAIALELLDDASETAPDFRLAANLTDQPEEVGTKIRRYGCSARVPS